jgi:crossover junction endodeoxyribonuclease RuvC
MATRLTQPRIDGEGPLRILGVDPGLNITGYAVIDCLGSRDAIVEAGTIRPDASDEMPRRIARIHAELLEIIDELTPRTVAIEQLYSHYKHPRTSILMAHARGAIMLAAAHRNLPVTSLAATQIKKSLTGNGRAGKRQIQLTVATLFGLDEAPEPADVADAMAIALCAGRTLGKR